ncbi:MAG: PKD domain-containing protein, partial [Bacteroidia bacterium]|nr:PKD domain-containing protein [Bacteroidia bacterium]
MLRKLTLIILLLARFSVFAQTVSISSNDYVCLNELISFQGITTGSVSSQIWNFGDNSSSTQINTSHQYSQYGPKNVTLEVTFSDGTKKTATKSIVVHDLPAADFSLSNSNFCFHQQNVCLTDNSTMGATTNGYSNRLVLWGDGAQTATSNPANSDVCYGSYLNTGTYTILLEVVNDKGCENKWQENITILKDYIASFYFNKNQAECNQQRVCFTNDSTTLSADVQSWEWDYGDGTTETGNWGQACHIYTSNGVFTVSLKVKLKNGCEAILKKNVTINFPKVETNISFGDTVLCWPSAFSFSNPVVAGAQYNWELYDADTNIIKIAGYNIIQQVVVPCPGDYFVRLKLKLGNCIDYSRYVKISSQGVVASFHALNKNQCSLEDTVYFLNTSKQHPDAKPIHFWRFGDYNAPNCIGIPPNCNNDTSKNSQHFYSDTGCYNPVLIVTDTVSGCIDSATGIVSITNYDEIEFEVKINRPCIGTKASYDVRFNNNLCDAKIKTCLDSLLDPTLFGDYTDVTYYPTVADTNGWVTVGFAVTLGSERIYRSADTSDYYIDSSRICQDTLWYHHWFRLYPEPIHDFKIERDPQCLPVNAKLVYNGGEDEKIALIKYVWEPNQAVQTINVYPDTVPDIEHLYTEEGLYDIFILLEDTNGCYEFKYEKQLFGYHNSIRADTIICLGNEVVFKDSIRYWNDPTPYWEQYNGVESISWDFGDGNGFDSTTHWPTYTYANKGNYQVRLASIDENGCTDTAIINVEVTGVNADIMNKGEVYLCDQVIQFLDSSYFDNSSSNDVIEEYYWDFGDYTTKSYLEDPFHYYSSNGEFTLRHAVTSKAGCTDTAEFTVYLSGPEPYFEILSDSVGCVPFTAKFKSISSKVTSLIWKMGDANNTTIYAEKDTIMEFTYNEPGIYYIYLDGSDSFYNA